MQLTIRAKDVRIDDHIPGIGVVVAVSTAQAVEVGVVGGGSCLLRAESKIEVHREGPARQPDTIKPNLCKHHNVIANSIKMHVDECFDGDGRMVVLIGYDLDTQAKTWQRVYDDEDLELV